MRQQKGFKVKSKTVILHLGWFCPPPSFRIYLLGCGELVERRAEHRNLLHTLKYTEPASVSKKHPARNVNSDEVEKSCFKVSRDSDSRKQLQSLGLQKEREEIGVIKCRRLGNRLCGARTWTSEEGHWSAGAHDLKTEVGLWDWFPKWANTNWVQGNQT